MGTISITGAGEPLHAAPTDVVYEHSARQPPLRVVVVDDHELLRAGTRRILDEANGFSVVGEAEDGEAALRLVAEVEPDVVLVDIRLPSMNGIDVARHIVADQPGVTVLILSAYDDEDYVRAALAAGVDGYLLKTTPSEELVRLIRLACTAPSLVDRRPLGRGEDGASRQADVPVQVPRLTVREREVVRLVARGMSNKATAHQLGISPRTVEGHLNHVFEKVGTTSRTELVRYALANSLFGRGHNTHPTTTP
ncbi:MAG: response regulator transcription factor [Acidimicrobiales bacterium]|jgi:DNA-binding NarL/FixJ family response regulator